MANLNSFYSRWSQRMLSILRIVSALLFMQHGAQKLFGFLAPMQATSHPLLSLMGIGGVLEFFGGLLLVLGVSTRPCCVCLVWASGSGLLHGACAKRVLAPSKRR